MNENKLTIKDSSLSFVASFLGCQFGAVLTTIIATIFYKISKPETTTVSTFFNTSYGYLISALGLYISMFLIFLFFNRKKRKQNFQQNKNKQNINIHWNCHSFIFMLIPNCNLR